MDERMELRDELRAIADRSRTADNSDIQCAAGVLYTLCGVLAKGDMYAFLLYVAEYSMQEMQRLQSKIGEQ